MLIGIRKSFQTGTNKISWLWKTMMFAIRHKRWLIISVEPKTNVDWYSELEYFGIDEEGFEVIIEDLAKYQKESMVNIKDIFNI